MQQGLSLIAGQKMALFCLAHFENSLLAKLDFLASKLAKPVEFFQQLSSYPCPKFWSDSLSFGMVVQGNDGLLVCVLFACAAQCGQDDGLRRRRMSVLPFSDSCIQSGSNDPTVCGV